MTTIFSRNIFYGLFYARQVEADFIIERSWEHKIKIIFALFSLQSTSFILIINKKRHATIFKVNF